MNLQKTKAFTLVELIVVITILAILGTIAFISLQGYSQDARDSTRLSDIGSMKKSLELYKLKSEKYPEPSGVLNVVTYSSIEVWTQGTFGEETFRDIKTISNIPLDPLTKTQYAYSLLNTKKEYELGSILEGELGKLNNQVNAGNRIAQSYVTGNYNGLVAKVTDTNTTYVLAIPTIINSDLSETNLDNIITNNKLAYKGTTILPGSYTGTTLNVEGNETEEVVKSTDYEIFSGDITILDPLTLTNNLQTAYTDTAISTQPEIHNLLTLDNNTEKTNYAVNVINNNLEGNILASDISYLDCDAGSVLGDTYNSINYNYGLIIHGETTNGTGTDSVSNGTNNYTGTISCNNGEISISNENENIVCNTNYTWNGSSCIADIRIANCTGKPLNFSSYNTLTSITQTWNGNDWLPINTASYNNISSSTSCRFKCNSGYSWNGSICDTSPSAGSNVIASAAQAVRLGTTGGWYIGSYTITDKYTAGKVCEGLYCYTDGGVWLYGSANTLCKAWGYKGAISGIQGYTPINTWYHIAHLGDGQYNDQKVGIETKHLETVTCVK